MLVVNDIFKFRPKQGGLIKYLGIKEWYNSLSLEERKKVKKYSRNDIIEGEISKSFLSGFSGLAHRAIYNDDIDFAIKCSKKALEAEGSLEEQHFTYNTLIEAYWKIKDRENVKKYCLKELEEFPKIGKALKEEFNNELPPSIPFRDRLTYIILNIEKDYDQGEKIYKSLLEVEAINEEEYELAQNDLKVMRMLDEASILLDRDSHDKAIKIFNEVIEIDRSQAADVYKTLGNYFFEKNNYEKSLEFFQKALKDNPFISGVKSKINKISKKLKIKVKTNNKEVLAILEKEEKNSKEWWQKRDLANEYVKIKQYDKAWGLFNEAVLLRAKSGMPCDTIYAHMARMLIREKKYKNALLQYALYFREWLTFSEDTNFPKYVINEINKCFGNLGIEKINYIDFFNLVKKTRDPSKFPSLINRIIPNKN